MVNEQRSQAKVLPFQALTVVAVVCCLSLGACSWIPKGETNLDVGIKDLGIASWYGAQFHGKLAANGEVFNMEALTAAHRTLPLGSMVRVVNLLNGKYVRVRINDRGPYVKGRILDLSHAAATQLGMEVAGVSIIKLEVIGDHSPEFAFDGKAGDAQAPPLLMVHNLDEKLPSAVLVSHLDRVSSKAMAAHRIRPNDILLQRRLKWVSAVFQADPAHQTHAGLVVT